MSTQTYPRIAVVDIPGKGKGVVALDPISKGTRILSEPPRIRVPHWQDRHQLPDVESFSPQDQEFFMSFPCVDGMDPISGRLRHLVPCVGSSDNASALFAVVCRMNHTCHSPKGRPNATYTWFEERNEEIVHATEDIAANEEITVSYIQAASKHTMDPREFLRQGYAFECQCPGCQRTPAERKESLARMQAYKRYTEDLPGRMGAAKAPLAILSDIESNILAICEEGYVSELSSCAHDAFQLCGFYGDGASAARWEVIAREVHRVIQGTDSMEYSNSAQLVKNPQNFRQWKALTLGKPRLLRGPSDKVLACFKSVVMSVHPRCNNARCTQSNTDTGKDATQFLRCSACLTTLSLDVYYCSYDCQKIDWSAGHKGVCGKQVKV